MDVSTGKGQFAEWESGRAPSGGMGLRPIVILHRHDVTVKGCNVYGQERH